MNKIESFVYKQVKNNYLLKNFLRNVYQGFFDLLPNYESKFLANPIVREGYYFGFHDLNPFSSDNTKHLANHLLIPLRMPTKDDALELGYFDGKNFSDWHNIAYTYAWNYHKGCRLQWLDDTHVIYNDVEQGMLCSKIRDVKSKAVKTINYPIDTASYDGKYATNFSYGRLQENMPGYGYVVKIGRASCRERV